MAFFLVVLVVCLSVLFSMAAVLILIMNGTAYAIPFAITAPAVLSVGLILLLHKYFTRVDRVLWFTGISAAALLITGFIPVRDFYRENLPVVKEEADPYPFESSNLYPETVQLDGGSSLRLEGNLPKLDGATAYFPIYAAFVQAVYPERDYTMNSGDSTVLYEHPRYAYHRLITGDRDLIFALPPTEQQLKSAEQAGVELSCTPIAKEAFVFYVNRRNPVDSLTETEIRSIYSGQFTEWSDVGGRKKAITAYQRKSDSRSQLQMEQVMDGEPLTAPHKEPVTRFSHGLVSQFAEYQNSGTALGYSYQNTVQPLVEERKVKLLQVDGVFPGDDEIRSGKYPYTQEICAVTANSENPGTGRFIEWILSDEGQELVKKAGFTPIRQKD